MKIELTQRSSSTVTEQVFQLTRGEQILIYKEWLNEKGKVTDSELRDVDGDEITDATAPDGNAAALLEEVQEFVDALEAKK